MIKSDDLARNVQRLQSRFAFGTQYYRPPTPRPEEWERDLDRIRELGMDHIRLWALWCFLERRPGEFRFEPYDRLIEMAGERSLGVCVNFVLDHVPVWAARKNDGYLISKDGAHARKGLLFGGHFACWDNPGMRADAEPFLRAFVERYRDKPHLVLWDVWNEVKYYRCWCPHSSAAFAEHLRKRFGDLESVNRELGTCFGKPNEIELPRHELDICLELAANVFERERLNEQMAWVRDVIRGVDKATPIMTHSHSWGSVTKGAPMWDDWTVRDTVDLWGASQHIIYYQNHHAALNRFAYTVANLESKRASGHYWLSELTTGILRGGLDGLRNRVNEGELTFNMWTFFAHGAKGFTFWQFHPERYSAEAPGWGLVAMDGGDTYHTREARRFFEALEAHRDFMENARPPRERVGVFYDPISSVLRSAMKRSDYTRCLHGIVYALWSHSVHFRMLREFDDFSDFETIFFPGAMALSDETLEKVLAYVEAGGNAIVEAGFGSYTPTGFYRTHVPGDGLHERFGYREVDILPLFDKDVSVELETTGLELDGLPANVAMHVGEKIVLGSYDYRRVERLGGTSALGYFPDGSPAALRAAIGRGRLIYFGSVVGPHLLECDRLKASAEFLEVTGVRPEIELMAGGRITGRLMQHDGERWLILFNHEHEETDALIPAGIALEPIFESMATYPELRFEPKGVKAFRIG